MIANTATILAIELLAAAQGIELLRPPASSASLEAAHALVRQRCAAMPGDRSLAPDIERGAGRSDTSGAPACGRSDGRPAGGRSGAGTTGAGSAFERAQGLEVTV